MIERDEQVVYPVFFYEHLKVIESTQNLVRKKQSRTLNEIEAENEAIE